MYFKSKKVSLLILGVTALVCSRTMLVSLDDPEGPNLLIVTVMGAVVYFSSLAVYLRNSLLVPLTGLTRLLFTILVQVAIVTGLFFLLN